MLAEVRAREAWVRVWVTGMDTLEWFYVSENQSSIPHLVGLNLNPQSDQGLLIGDWLLADAVGQRRLPRERWQRYARERLSARSK